MDTLETKVATLEARIVALESDNERLKYELTAIYGIVDSIEAVQYPWGLSFVEQAELNESFTWKPVKKFPIAERNALIRLMHGRGLTVEQIAAELFARNFKHPKGGLVHSGVIEKVIKDGGRDAQETE